MRVLNRAFICITLWIRHTASLILPKDQGILIKRVLEINESEKIDMLIPNFDAELLSFMKYREQLFKGRHSYFSAWSLDSLKRGINPISRNSERNMELMSPPGNRSQTSLN